MKKLYKLLSVSLIVTCMVLSSACGGKKGEDKAEEYSGKTEQHVLEDVVTLEIPSDFEVGEDEYIDGIIISKDNWEVVVSYDVMDEITTIEDSWASYIKDLKVMFPNMVSESTVNGKSAVTVNYDSIMMNTLINLDDVHCVSIGVMIREESTNEELVKLFNDPGIQHIINSVKVK